VAVRVVLCFGREPKVAPSIVGRVQVPMIDKVRRPFARLPEPNNPVDLLEPPSDIDDKISALERPNHITNASVL
jgi:hypothetical protein